MKEKKLFFLFLQVNRTKKKLKNKIGLKNSLPSSYKRVWYYKRKYLRVGRWLRYFPTVSISIVSFESLKYFYGTFYFSSAPSIYVFTEPCLLVIKLIITRPPPHLISSGLKWFNNETCIIYFSCLTGREMLL